MKMHPPSKTAVAGIVGCLLLSIAPVRADDNPISVDFNDPSDLTNLFNGTDGALDYNASTGGLGGSGMVQMVPGVGPGFANNVWTSAAGFTNTVGVTYSVSVFMNGSHGGIGFSMTNMDRPYTYGAPGESLGVNLDLSEFGDNHFFCNYEQWQNTSSDIVTYDSGAWQKVTLSVTSLGDGQFQMHFVAQDADANGNVGATLSDCTTVMSSTLAYAGILYPFFLSGLNASNVDNFSATMEAVPEPSTYALLLLGGLGAIQAARRRKAAAR